MSTVVTNCPGWTVYNVAVHIGRVGVAWRSMIDASPDDPDSRARGYADAESRGSGHSPGVLATWVRGAVEALEGDVDHPAYFSMTGGAGTVAVKSIALAGNTATIVILHRIKTEDAHLQASWIFTANDIRVNALVIAAAIAVLLTDSAIPDLIAGAFIFAIVANGARRIINLTR